MAQGTSPRPCSSSLSLNCATFQSFLEKKKESGKIHRVRGEGLDQDVIHISKLFEIIITRKQNKNMFKTWENGSPWKRSTRTRRRITRLKSKTGRSQRSFTMRAPKSLPAASALSTAAHPPSAHLAIEYLAGRPLLNLRVA